MTFYRLLGLSLFLVPALAVAGCSGGTQSPSMPGVTGAMGSAPVAPLPQDRQGCQKSDGIDVLPCRISFDTNHPGPSNVRVTSGGDQRMLVEKDDCVLRGVATVTMRRMHEYSVAAGTASGSCTAHFTQKVHNNDGKGGGGGSSLVINNRL
jgi:hypothetical protein